MKNYLIIGGSSGIGKSIVNKLSELGHAVYATYNKTPIQERDWIFTKQMNVLDPIVNLDFLPPTLDGFVYCPGSIQLRPFKRISPEAFVKDFELQVLGGIKILQQILPLLKSGNSSSVVFFSTIAVQKGFNFHTQVATSKGAIEGLTRSLAAELAPEIRVNAIAPSITNTPLASNLLSSEEKMKANANRHPLKQIGTPDNIADAAIYLLTEKSSWVTGQILHVDGGMSSINS